MLRIGDHRELQAVVLAMRAMNKSLARDIRKDTKRVMDPEWKALVRANATTHMDTLVLAKGARIASGNPPSVVAASSKRALSGGLVPVEHWQAYEFGSGRNRKTTYTRRNRATGGTHQVTRNTTRQLPRRARSGRVLYASFAELAPRLASLWVQTCVRRMHEAAEGRQ